MTRQPLVNPVTGEPDPRLASLLIIDPGLPSEERVAIDTDGMLVRFDGPNLIVVGPAKEWITVNYHAQ